MFKIGFGLSFILYFFKFSYVTKCLLLKFGTNLSIAFFANFRNLSSEAEEILNFQKFYRLVCPKFYEIEHVIPG